MKLLRSVPILATLIMSLYLSNSVYSRNIFTSSCGYSVELNVTPIAIIPTETNCPVFYNYNVRFTYQMTIINGPIPNGYCGGGAGGSLWTAQVEVFCYGNANGSYQLPLNGGSGTITTSSANTIYNNGTINQYSSPYIHCSQANTIDFECTQARIRLEGPGLNINTTIELNPIIPLGEERVQLKAEQTNNHSILLRWDKPKTIQYKKFLITHQDKEGKFINQYEVSNDKEQLQVYTDKYTINYFELFGVLPTQNNFLDRTSIALNTTELITIYPNPSRGNKLNIKTSTDVKNYLLVITNTVGQFVQQYSITEANESIELTTNLTPGVYLLHFYLDDMLLTKTYTVI